MNGMLDTGIRYHGRLPLLVETLDTLPAEFEQLRISESNELLLKAVSVLEDKPEHDETDPVHQELKRQDLKITLLLDMLGSLLVQNCLLPQPQEVELTTDTLQLRSGEPVASGQLCRISLYIDGAVPKPLVLFAHSQPAQPDYVSFVFTALAQNVRDNLDKFIFRYHRRLVAQNRKV